MYCLYSGSSSSCLYLYSLLGSSTENTQSRTLVFHFPFCLSFSLFPWSLLFLFGFTVSVFVLWLGNEHAHPTSWYISISQSKNIYSYYVFNISLILSVYFCLYLSSLLPWHQSCLPAFLSQSVSVSLFICLSHCEPYVMKESCEIRGEGSHYAPVGGHPHFPLISAGLPVFVSFCSSFSLFLFSTFPPDFLLNSSVSRTPPQR